MKAIPDIIKNAARDLRKNMTSTEKILWEEIRAKKLLWKKFWRQNPIYVFTEDSWLDRYVIPDFVSFQEKLIIEIDWSVHDDEDVYNLDRIKEKLLQKLWFTIIRFTNEEVINNRTSIFFIIETIF